MPRATVAKEDFLTGTTSYVKLGKDFYVMKKVKGITDPSEEAKEMYRKQYQKATKELKDVVSTELTGDWNKQLKKLTDTRESTIVTIPAGKYNKPVYYRTESKTLLDIRVCVYHPVEILTTKDWLESNNIELNNLQIGQLSPFGGNAEIVVTVKNDIYIPFLAGFDDKIKKVYTFGVQTFHTFADSGLCIGHSRYEDYKALGDKHLSEQISRTNTFSPANYEIKVKDVTIARFQDLIKANTVINIRRKDGAAWTT